MTGSISSTGALLLLSLQLVATVQDATSAFLTNPTSLAHGTQPAFTRDGGRSDCSTILVPWSVKSVSLLSAKKAKKKRRSGGPTYTGDDDSEGGEIPANLRRKVTARRPPLGHVVPKALRTRTDKGGTGNPKLRPQGRARDVGMNNPSMLRIIAGTARGRRLDSPNVYLRPMMGKVREAVFSTLTSFGLYDVSNTRHLDIFAGSGSVGLESLSRGAAHCTFVDMSEDCCDAVRRNVDWCDFTGRADVVCGEAISVLTDPVKSGGFTTPLQPYQIVTLCPPYEEITYGDLLEAVVNSPLVADDTVVLVEYPVELGCLPHVVHCRRQQPDADDDDGVENSAGTSNDGDDEDGGGAMIGVRNRKYGRTVIAMYVVNPTGKLEVANSRPEEFVSL